ncbi:MAG: ABC transporter permease [Blautia sp.]|nr:ABC transporter permease [Blautia sp.]
MLENIRLAFQGVWSHKMRSFLTMLGIIIGIAAIIAIVSSIKGTNEQLKESLIGAGNNTVSVDLYEGDSTYGSGWSMGNAKPPLLTKEQKEAVLAVDHVVTATFYYKSESVYNVYYGTTTFQGGTIYGIDQRYLSTNGYHIRQGRAFAQRDYDKYRKVALLDVNAVENLFSGKNPVGEIIEIGSEPFTVVGVIEQDSAFAPKINSYEDYMDYNYNGAIGTVMIPDTDWPITNEFDQPQFVIIKADSTDNMTRAGNDVAKVLNQNIPAKSTFTYKANDVLERFRESQQLAESTNIQLIMIASISLLVGGIGVMNIMLVSVTERTREIGLKKAIGAKKSAILGQFLTEAAVLTSIGGLMGVALGVGLSKLMSRFAGIPSAISVPAILVAVGFSTFIGIIFGLLPSVQAAKLNPIDALRSD